MPFDEPPFRPERTGPHALPEDVLQAARAQYDVPGMLGRTERCYLQVVDLMPEDMYSPSPYPYPYP